MTLQKADRRQKSTTAAPTPFPPSPSATVSELSSLPSSTCAARSPRAIQVAITEPPESQDRSCVVRPAPESPEVERSHEDRPAHKRRRREKTAPQPTSDTLMKQTTTRDIASAPPPQRVSKVKYPKRSVSPKCVSLGPPVSETVFQQTPHVSEGSIGPRSGKSRARRKPKRKAYQNKNDSKDPVAKTADACLAEAPFPHPVPWDGEEETLRYDNKGRPLRVRKPPKRLLEEIEGAANRVLPVEDVKLSCPLPTPGLTDALSSSTSVNSPSAQVSQPKKKRPKLVRKLSAPNEHGIVIEEAENPGSAPLGLSKRRAPPKNTCKYAKISPRVLKLLELPFGNSQNSATADGKSSDKPRLTKIKTSPEQPSPGYAEDPTESPPTTPTEVAEATSKTDDLPPVRVPGIQSSAFASVMRIVSGVCPLQPSPRLDRICRPSVAPPVWAQVSKSGFG